MEPYTIMPTLVQGIWIASAVAQFAVFLRIHQLRLLSRYPFLAAFLAGDVAVSVAMWFMRPRGWAYIWTYVGTRPLLAILEAAAAIECFRRSWEHYENSEGIQAVIRRRSLMIAIAFSAIIIPLELRGIHPVTAPMQAAFLIHRAAGTAFAVFLVVGYLGTLKRVIPHMRSNVYNNMRYFGIYLGLQAAACAAVNLLHYQQPATNIVSGLYLTGLTVLLIVWRGSLSCLGEIMPLTRPLTDRERYITNHQNWIPFELSARGHHDHP